MSEATRSTPPRPLPPESVAGAPFWEATREQRLVLPWCRACEVPHWYPRGFCPTCLSGAIEWRPASGDAEVHAVSVQPKAPHPGLRERAPYAVAVVSLVEGVRMMVAVAADDPWAVRVGDRVTLGWEPLADGRHLPVAMHTD